MPGWKERDSDKPSGWSRFILKRTHSGLLAVYPTKNGRAEFVHCQIIVCCHQTPLLPEICVTCSERGEESFLQYVFFISCLPGLLHREKTENFNLWPYVQCMSLPLAAMEYSHFNFQDALTLVYCIFLTRDTIIYESIKSSKEPVSELKKIQRPKWTSFGLSRKQDGPSSGKPSSLPITAHTFFLHFF